MDDQAEEAVAVEDRMMALLDVEEEQEAEEVEAPKTESETEETVSDEEEAEEPVKLKLKRGDEEVEVTYDEAVELAQKGYDYTKKTQEIAENRKQTEMYAQALKAQEQMLHQQAELQTALFKEIAKVESYGEQITQFEALDWATLTDTDPVQAQKLWIQYQTLQNKRTQAQGELQQKHSHLIQQRQQSQAARLEQARTELLKVIPDFNEEKAQAIRHAGKEYGFSDDELSSLSDPRQVKVLADAAAYRKLLAEKGKTDKKVIGKPVVVKPGTKDAKTADSAKVAQMREKLHKTGDQHVAAALIEKML